MALISSELLEHAPANAPAARFAHASLYEFQFWDYDAVVAVGNP